MYIFPWIYCNESCTFIQGYIIIYHVHLSMDILQCIMYIYPWIYCNVSCTFFHGYIAMNHVHLSMDILQYIMYMYPHILLSCNLCLGVCLGLFVSNKRQNGWTDRAQIFCGTSRDHREGLWTIKIFKNVFWRFLIL